MNALKKKVILAVVMAIEGWVFFFLQALAADPWVLLFTLKGFIALLLLVLLAVVFDFFNDLLKDWLNQQ